MAKRTPHPERDYYVWADLFPSGPSDRAIAERRRRERAVLRRLAREAVEYAVLMIDRYGDVLDDRTQIYGTARRAVAAARNAVAADMPTEAVGVVVERRNDVDGEYRTIWVHRVPGRRCEHQAEAWFRAG